MNESKQNLLKRINDNNEKILNTENTVSSKDLKDLKAGALFYNHQIKMNWNFDIDNMEKWVLWQETLMKKCVS